jgi:hypothetical protein
MAQRASVEVYMDQPVNAFDLSPEQQETASLLQRLLGSAIANRYVDFCRLAAGAFALNVSRPMAAHALRELDSMLRGALEVPMEAKAPETVEDAEKIAQARKQLRALGFDDQVIDRAARELKPRLNHKQQIRQIVSRLGLAPDGDIANLWTSLTENFGGAHQRSFHHSLQVDDDFREKYHRPFDTVIRAVAVALQGRYVALMHRVEELAAMSDRKQAAKLFATFPARCRSSGTSSTSCKPRSGCRISRNRACLASRWPGPTKARAAECAFANGPPEITCCAWRNLRKP